MAGGSTDGAVLIASTASGSAELARQARRASLTLGMLIAGAIGLHNFSEGLAIGVSARAGEIGLATTLIVGFALHNATEGFGIVGPLNGVVPSWKWIGVAGLIGGGPTFLGSLVGYQVSSPALEICFFALAAGAILFVVGQLWTAANRRISTDIILGALVLGYLAGLASDLVITYGGG
jgi:ZIP family zinc transporter